jgi:hypothetical protein
MMDIMLLAKRMREMLPITEGVRLIGIGGVMPLFSQVAHKEATQARECALHVQIVFEMCEWSDALIHAWAKERLQQYPLRQMWTKPELERAARGEPVYNLDTRQTVDAH